jgi:phage shock protein PspC (stress-responsive transcriptional regulator)
MNTSMQSSNRLLRRPINDRAFAGVASGLGRRFDVSPTWFRVGFVLLTIFGGAGLVLYAIGWLLIPDEGSDEPLIAEWIDGFDTSNTAMVIGVVLIGLGALILISGISHVFAFSGKFLFAAILLVGGVLLYRGDLSRKEPPADGGGGGEGAEVTERIPVDVSPAEMDTVEGGDTEATARAYTPPAPLLKPSRPRSILGRLTVAVLLVAVGTLAILDIGGVLFPEPVHYAALIVGIVGGGLLIGTLFGRARWLIVVGLILTPILFLTSLGAPTWSISGGAGDRYVRIDTIGDLEVAGFSYEQGAGVLEIDLRSFEAPPSEVGVGGIAGIPIHAKIGAGEIRILLPEGAGASVSGKAGIGSVDILGHQSAGIGVSRTANTGSNEGPPFFVIDAKAGVGSVVVTEFNQIWEG